MSQTKINSYLSPNQSSLSTVIGQSGCGKSSFLVDHVCNFITSTYEKELLDPELNKLTSLLNGPVPVLFISGEVGIHVLSRIQKRLFPKDTYPFNTLLHTFNFCRVVRSSTSLEELKQTIQMRRIQLVVIDECLLEVQQILDLAKFCMGNQTALIQSVQSRKSLSSSSPLVFSGPSNQIQMMSSVVLNLEKQSFNSLDKTITMKISVLKNRFGPVNEEFKYECQINR